MKMKYFYLCHLYSVCVLVFATAITGCSSPKDANIDATGQQVSKPPLSVSVLLPLTGPGASGAGYSKKGFELALEEILKNGGKLEVKYEDTQTNPKTAVSIFHQIMASSSPPSVLVPQLSSTMNALKPLLTKDVLTVSTGVSLPDVVDKDRGIFRVFLNAQDLAETASQWAVNNNRKSACVVYVDDEYGRASLHGFKNFFLKNGGNQVLEEPFSLLEKDFRTQAQKIIDNMPDCVFIAGYGPGYLAALSHISSLGYSGTIITDWSITDPDYMQATKSYSEGFYVVAVEPPNIFNEKYINKYNESGSLINAGFSYDVLMIIWKAYQTSDGTVEGMLQSLYPNGHYQGIMPVKSVLPSGDLLMKYSVYKIIAGKLVIQEFTSGK